MVRDMDKQHTFQHLIDITRTVIQAFDVAEQRPWLIEVTMVELMKQVGDLARCVMVIVRYYLPDRADAPEYATTDMGIADELADILYCLIRIADHYHVDLEQAHLQARRKEFTYLGMAADF